MKKSEKNQIHVIDIKNDTIKPMSNSELCSFINDMIDKNNPIASINDLKNKRFLFLPNQEAAFYVVSSMIDKADRNQPLNNPPF